MPRLKHFYGQNHYHYLTESIYRRARIFDSDRFKHQFVRTLDELRSELGFKIFGYVLMPEHGHLLIWPSPAANPSQIMQKLSERTANFILPAISGTILPSLGAGKCWRDSNCRSPCIIMRITAFGTGAVTT